MQKRVEGSTYEAGGFGDEDGHEVGEKMCGRKE